MQFSWDREEHLIDNSIERRLSQQKKRISEITDYPLGNTLSLQHLMRGDNSTDFQILRFEDLKYKPLTTQHIMIQIMLTFGPDQLMHILWPVHP